MDATGLNSNANICAAVSSDFTVTSGATATGRHDFNCGESVVVLVDALVVRFDLSGGANVKMFVFLPAQYAWCGPFRSLFEPTFLTLVRTVDGVHDAGWQGCGGVCWSSNRTDRLACFGIG